MNIYTYIYIYIYIYTYIYTSTYITGSESGRIWNVQNQLSWAIFICCRKVEGLLQFNLLFLYRRHTTLTFEIVGRVLTHTHTHTHTHRRTHAHAQTKYVHTHTHSYTQTHTCPRACAPRTSHPLSLSLVWVKNGMPTRLWISVHCSRYLIDLWDSVRTCSHPYKSRACQRRHSHRNIMSLFFIRHSYSSVKWWIKKSHVHLHTHSYIYLHIQRGQNRAESEISRHSYVYIRQMMDTEESRGISLSIKYLENMHEISQWSCLMDCEIPRVLSLSII